MGSPKKVEFASTHLEPIDSEAPTLSGTINNNGSVAQPSGGWDTETGDGGGASHVGSSIPTAADFASTSFSNRHDSHSSSDRLQSLRAPTTTNLNGDDQGWSELPPPTPAVHFYSHTPQTSNVHHNPHNQSPSATRRSNFNNQLNHANYGSYPLSQQQPIEGQSKSSITTSLQPPDPELQQNQSQQQQQPHPSFTSTSQSSSASSLSSMAAALIAGAGPAGLLYNNHYSQRHLQRVASHTSGGSTPPIESPISPAAMIGLGYENLLLPPPSGPIAATSIPSPVPPNHTHHSDNNNQPMPQQLPNLLPQHHPQPLLPNITAGLFLPQAAGSLTPQQLHRQQLLYATAAAHAVAAANRPVESQEKRAQRLERNRESARKSRRRKKERLVALGEMVQKLQNTIAIERRRHIDAMVPALRKSRTHELAKLLEQSSSTMLNHEVAQNDLLARIIRGSGPSSPIMRAVLDFQYTTLKQMTLPSYQKMLLWFTLREESYFLAGKEQYAAQQEQQMASNGGSSVGIGAAAATTAISQSKPWTKVSSKQIGDEMLNGPGGSKAKLPGGSKNKRQSNDDSNDDVSMNPTSNAYDAARFWPLLCFELKFSVDQEERFLSTYRQIVANEASSMLAERRSQMAAAVHTAESLGKAVGSLGHIVAQREEKSYLNILEPKQVSKYQAWLEQNRERVRVRSFPTANSGDSGSSNNEVSLQDICRRLNEVLQISTTSQNDPIGSMKD